MEDDSGLTGFSLEIKEISVGGESEYFYNPHYSKEQLKQEFSTMESFILPDSSNEIQVYNDMRRVIVALNEQNLSDTSNGIGAGFESRFYSFVRQNPSFLRTECFFGKSVIFDDLFNATDFFLEFPRNSVTQRRILLSLDFTSSINQNNPNMGIIENKVARNMDIVKEGGDIDKYGKRILGLRSVKYFRSQNEKDPGQGPISCFPVVVGVGSETLKSVSATSAAIIEEIKCQLEVYGLLIRQCETKTNFGNGKDIKGDILENIKNRINPAWESISSNTTDSDQMVLAQDKVFMYIREAVGKYR